MLRSTATIPVIVCTAATTEVHEIEGDPQSKGISVVAKPFDLDDLLLTVKRALQLRPHDADMVAHAEARTGNAASATSATTTPGGAGPGQDGTTATTRATSDDDADRPDGSRDERGPQV